MPSAYRVEHIKSLKMLPAMKIVACLLAAVWPLDVNAFRLLRKMNRVPADVPEFRLDGDQILSTSPPS